MIKPGKKSAVAVCVNGPEGYGRLRLTGETFVCSGTTHARWTCSCGAAGASSLSKLRGLNGPRKCGRWCKG